MSQLTQALTPPLIQQVPNPEPPGFAQIRQMLEDQLFRRNANPYGMSPGGSMQSNPLNPFGGKGLFNPYTGQRDTSGATSSMPPWLMGMMGGGGGQGGGMPMPGGGMGGPRPMGGGNSFGGSLGGPGGPHGAPGGPPGGGMAQGGLQALLAMLGGGSGPAQQMGGGMGMSGMPTGGGPQQGAPQTVPFRGMPPPQMPQGAPPPRPPGPPPGSQGAGYDGVRYDSIGPTAVGTGTGYYQYGSQPGTGDFHSWAGGMGGGNQSAGQAAGAGAVNSPVNPNFANWTNGPWPQFQNSTAQGITRPPATTTPFAPPGAPPAPPPNPAPLDPNNPNPGNPHGRHDITFDGQITNPQPYPGESSPMPYDGTPQKPEDSMIDRAITHLKQLLGMGGAPSQAPPTVPGQKKPDMFLPEHKGMNIDHQQQYADQITGDAPPPTPGPQYDAYNAVRMPMRPGMLSQSPSVAPHIHAPMSLPPSAQHIGIPKNPMASLNHILGGMGSANRHGQVAAYKVGRPGAVFDGYRYDANDPRMPINQVTRPNLPGSQPPATNPTSGTSVGFNPTTSYANNNATGSQGGYPAPGSLNGGQGGGMGSLLSGSANNSSSSPYPTGGQTLGGAMYPWMMPYTGQQTAPMSPFQNQGLAGASSWMQGNMGLNPAFQYNNDLLSGKYIGSGSPYMQQIQQGAQGLKDTQDNLARQRIASSMAAGGNALSGARANADQQYQNASDSAFQQQMGQMNLQDLQQERALQNQGVAQQMGLGSQLMGGYGQLMNMGAVPQQTQQNDLNAQYSDWLRQIGAMQQGDQFQQQMQNQMLHSGYPGSQQPQYGSSTLAGLAGLLGGTGAFGNNGWLSSLIGGAGSALGNLFGGSGSGSGNNQTDLQYGNPYDTSQGNWSTPDQSQQFGPTQNDWLTNWLNQYGGNTGGYT